MGKKQEERARLLNIRKNILPEQREEASHQICRHLLASEVLEAGAFVYGYFPLREEVDIRMALEELLGWGCHVALPKVCGTQMDFVEVTDLDRDLKEGSFHVMEPVSDQVVHWPEAFVLVPGVGFDRQGARMGYGKGYYDRYFFAHPCCMLIGIAYEEQVAEQICAEPHDLRMDAICTQNGMYSVTRSKDSV